MSRVISKTSHITSEDNNVFCDFGFEPEGAGKMLGKSNEQISERLANTECLRFKYSAWFSIWIDEKHSLDQIEVASFIGML